MNPNFPPNPQEEQEARITAWLLGELPADEAARVRQEIERDPRLQTLRDQLSQTLNLLRETVATPAGETPASPVKLKLSQARREKLLAGFKTVRPQAFEKRKSRFTLLEIAAVLAGLGILATLLFPKLANLNSHGAQSAIMVRLQMLDAAKKRWAADNNKPDSATPTLKDLGPYLGAQPGGKWGSVAGETYDLGPVGKAPVADFRGKELTIAGGRTPSVNTPGRLADSVRTDAEGIDQAKSYAPTPAASVPPASSAAGKIVLPAPAGPDVAQLEEQEKFSRKLDFRSGRELGDVAGQNKSPVPATPPPMATLVNTASLAPAQPVPSAAFALAPDSNGTVAGGPVNPPGGVGGTVGTNPLHMAGNIAGAPILEIAVADQPVVQPESRSAGQVASSRSPTPAHGGMVMVQAPPADNSISFPFSVLKRRHVALTPVPPSQAPEIVTAPGISASGESLSDVPAMPAPVPENKPAAIQPKVVPLKFARASDVADALRSLGATGGTSIGRSTSGVDFASRKDVELANRDRAANNVPTIDQKKSRDADSRRTIYLGEPGASRKTALQFAAADKNREQEVSKAFAPVGGIDKLDGPLRQGVIAAPVPQPEVQTSANPFTTFSLNISDVAFNLARASLEKGQMPDPASMRSEEFINAFDYRDPEPPPGAPIGFAWERAGDPFAHNRDFVRFSIRTAAQGREDGRPLNIVLLLDTSGSMERADRVAIIDRALQVLATKLHPNDGLSVVTFARTARLFADGLPGNQAGAVARKLREITPEGGTNLEEAMRLAYETAMRHYLAQGENRVILLTDGAANLGDVTPATLKRKVESNRKQGVAFDCFGVGWDGYNDQLLETLSRAGNGRYGFINTPEEAGTEFAGKLAGALRVAAADVKVQVEFNPQRVTAYRQIGYAKDQLKKEDFRDNSVKAAQIGAAEAGNALYTLQINPAGEGPLGTVHVRYRIPGTQNYEEHAWTLPYTGGALPLDQASAAMRLSATAASFAEWLAGSPYAADVTPDRLLQYLRGVPQVYGADQRPKTLEWMIQEAGSLSGKGK
jgi:Mg-chelatase subunit ChlD/type II secretory pathway pseudopilin PulG